MTQRLIYQVVCPYFITINTFSRRHLFSQRKFTLLLYGIIIEACRLKEFDLYAFCILSDHVHLLVKKQTDATRDGCVVWRGATSSAVRAFEIGASNLTTQASVPAGWTIKTISSLLHCIKSYYVKEMRQKCGINFKLWQSRYNFRIIDSDKRFINTLNYIGENYKKKGLSEKYSRYPFQFINKKLIDDFFN